MLLDILAVTLLKVSVKRKEQLELVRKEGTTRDGQDWYENLLQYESFFL